MPDFSGTVEDFSLALSNTYYITSSKGGVGVAYLFKKKVKGKDYYYIGECKWVDGRPRTVTQKYLGSLEKIEKRMTGPVPQPYTAEIYEYGASAALFSMARELDVIGTIDRHAPKRDQGLSVGEYVLLAALNRAISPSSKRKLGDWFETSALYHWIPVAKPSLLASQRFWDHMDRLDQDTIRAIEAEITERMVNKFHLDLRCLIYDTTNFITWIDTMSEAELAQRGHSKEKRYDLKIVGLSLMLTTDFQIPLFHQIYPGNRTDSTQFGSVTDELVQRYKRLAGACNDVTLIYDKGNNSGPNQKAIDDGPFHFVGSLKSSEAPELLEVPQSDYTLLKGGDLAGTSAYRVQREVFGAKRTVVVTYNEALYLGQLQGHLLRLRKMTESLKELATSLVRRAEQVAQKKKFRGKPPTVDSVEQQVRGIVDKAGNPYKQWVKTTVEADDNGVPQLLYQVDHAAMDAFNVRHLGKNILFTDRDDWSSEDIVRAYRSQWHVEAAFREMKNPHFLSWEPQFHWTDQKIMVHAFYCILALTLANLTRRKLHLAGIDLSTEAMLEQLTGIQEVVHVYPKGSTAKNCITLSELTSLQRQIITKLGLDDPGTRGGDKSCVVGG